MARKMRCGQIRNNSQLWMSIKWFVSLDVISFIPLTRKLKLIETVKSELNEELKSSTRFSP
jgi:hypothetical protein